MYEYLHGWYGLDRTSGPIRAPESAGRAPAGSTNRRARTQTFARQEIFDRFKQNSRFAQIDFSSLPYNCTCSSNQFI